jgi:hypothetical protein
MVTHVFLVKERIKSNRIIAVSGSVFRCRAGFYDKKLRRSR